MININNRKHNVLDLFAGCGGMSEGFEMAGLNVVCANDVWKPAAATFQINHPETKFVLGDIRNPDVRERIYETFNDIDCDIIAGGIPCVAFSMSGKRDPDDPRGHLFDDYLDIVDALQPKVLMIENVIGIRSMIHERPPFWDTSKISLDTVEPGSLEEAMILAVTQETVSEKIVRMLNAKGYNVEYITLNAADYGVPQNRKRVVFVGVRNDLLVPEEFPEPITHGNEGSVRNAIGDLRNHPEDKNWSHTVTRHRPEFLERIQKTPIGKSVNEAYSESWHRAHPDKPAPTVKANNGGVFLHYEQDRCMTPRELARLQSFPDDYLFKGSKGDVLKQIGNAVPPLLGKAIGECVKGMLDAITDDEIEFQRVDALEQPFA